MMKKGRTVYAASRVALAALAVALFGWATPAWPLWARLVGGAAALSGAAMAVLSLVYLFTGRLGWLRMQQGAVLAMVGIAGAVCVWQGIALGMPWLALGAAGAVAAEALWFLWLRRLPG